MKKYITAVYQFASDEEMGPTLTELKNGFMNDKICALSIDDEMTKLDQIRELAEEHGQGGFDKIMEILNA